MHLSDVCLSGAIAASLAPSVYIYIYIYIYIYNIIIKEDSYNWSKIRH